MPDLWIIWDGIINAISFRLSNIMIRTVDWPRETIKSVVSCFSSDAVVPIPISTPSKIKYSRDGLWMDFRISFRSYFWCLNWGRGWGGVGVNYLDEWGWFDARKWLSQILVKDEYFGYKLVTILWSQPEQNLRIQQLQFKILGILEKGLCNSNTFNKEFRMKSIVLWYLDRTSMWFMTMNCLFWLHSVINTFRVEHAYFE